MSLPLNDSLSAFHDGEIAAAERSVVEQHLIVSAEARRELSEIRQVSLLLKDLSSESLPSEFSQRVLSTIERRTIERSVIERSTIEREPSIPSSNSSTRRWTMGAVAILTSAAALMLVIRTFNDGRGLPASRTEMQLAGVPTLRSGSGEVAFNLSEARKMADAGGLGGGSALGAPALNSEAPIASDSPISVPGAAGANFVASNSQSNSLARRAKGSASDLKFDQSSFQTAEIGDVIEALQTDGDEVAVVTFTVVDRQVGLERLQVLLAKNQIAYAEDSAAPEFAEKALDSSAKPTAGSLAIKTKASAIELSRPNSDSAKQFGVAADGVAGEQMLAVFVESDSQHLAAALRQLRETELVQSFSVEPPIVLTQVEGSDGALAKLGEKDNSRAAGVNAPRDGNQAFSESLAAARGLAKRREPAGDFADRKSGDKNSFGSAKLDQVQARSKETATFARQFALQLPADMLTPTLPEPQASTLSRARSSAANSSRAFKPAGDVATAEKAVRENNFAPADSRQVQVLFVLVGQTQASSGKPATPVPGKSIPTKVRSQPAKPNLQNQDGALQGRSALPPV